MTSYLAFLGVWVGVVQQMLSILKLRRSFHRKVFKEKSKRAAKCWEMAVGVKQGGLPLLAIPP
jgi:hypothetical protein